MPSQFSLPHHLRIVLPIILCLLTATLVTAQEQPAPQFLYRDGDHLVLVNGYTGETTQLPFLVKKQDRFSWSPDGKYILARLSENDTFTYCLNLYDVDKQEWLYQKPISCAVGSDIFSDDGTQIYYSAQDGDNGVVWLYTLKDEKRRELYRTTDGNNISPSGISGFKWSPTRTYLTFEDYHQIMGGTLNGLVVMNAKTEHYMTLYAPNPYYADYHPIWSTDEHWFLIVLYEQYVYSAAFPRTNHHGDVYLVNSETGENYRLTYTPAEYEVDVHWTDDGSIAFTEVSEQKMTYTIEQAKNIPPVPRDQIVEPEPVNPEDYDNRGSGIMFSPDPSVGAWVTETDQGDKSSYKLNIGDTFSTKARFSVPIPNPGYSNDILIGWRPSDYPYPQG